MIYEEIIFDRLFFEFGLILLIIRVIGVDLDSGWPRMTQSMVHVSEAATANDDIVVGVKRTVTNEADS